MWLVLFCHKDASGKANDGWSAHDTREEAERVYDECLREDGIYSVSLCAPVKSTDYDNPLD